MKAAVYHRYGPPEVVRIEEVARPVPKDDEVLVRVQATTVCAADWRLRKPDPFFIRFMIGLRRPTKVQVLGMELAGTVEAVGAAVTRFHVGDCVFGGTGFAMGAHAEYACVRESGTLALQPANMTTEEAAAVMFGGITALHFLRLAKVEAGQRVLVYGASGSVGNWRSTLARTSRAWPAAAICRWFDPSGPTPWWTIPKKISRRPGACTTWSSIPWARADSRAA